VLGSVCHVKPVAGGACLDVHAAERSSEPVPSPQGVGGLGNGRTNVMGTDETASGPGRSAGR
jgi:hypothetical protein